MTTFEYPASVEVATVAAHKRRIYETLGLALSEGARDELAALIAELAVLEAMGTAQLGEALRARAAKAYLLLKDEAPDEPGIERIVWCLRVSTLALIADRPADARRLLAREPVAPLSSPATWFPHAKEVTLLAWLALIRKSDRTDVELPIREAEDLRQQQESYEAAYLRGLPPEQRKATALELVGTYNLIRASERLSQYVLTGRSDGTTDIGAQLDMHFERSLEAFERAHSGDLLDVCILLQVAARQMVANALSTAVRSANTLAQGFADALINRAINPIFELLPPQRAALYDEGLISTSRRSIVVNLPTSSGKTLIAQFALLQAKADLGEAKGFSVYIAPTRALVNQVCAKLRSDFSSVKLRVERLSPALEFDSIERSLIQAGADGSERDEPSVDVLVCTPEKFDLLMRRDDIAATLGRLALVVVDEAHNIGGSDSRAIKLELLLSMLNREHRDARFLLLTPFVENADEVASWLDQKSSRSYSIAAEWVPNDRVVALALPPEGESKRGKLVDTLRLKLLSTPKHTLFIDEELVLPGVSAALSLTEAESKKTVGRLATAAAQVLSTRGPTVLLCRKVADTWAAAAGLSKVAGPSAHLDGAVSGARELAARFISYELGDDFPLAEHVRRGVAVHHSGLPEEVSQLIEQLFARRQLAVLCATSTISQGVNFPLSNLVIASIATTGYRDLSYSEFWNVAGRVGRVDQETIGVIALASSTLEQQAKHSDYVKRSLTALASQLVVMAEKLHREHSEQGLEAVVYTPEWSAFAQFITHTFRQVGVSKFAEQLELILRGTFGYKELRERNTVVARNLLNKTLSYARRLASDMGAVKLVDATGFSFESVKATLGRLQLVRNPENLLDGDALFSGDSRTLRDVMGVLLTIPEVRENLSFGGGSDGSMLAEMVADWVQGRPIPDIANDYFEAPDYTTRVTDCTKKFRQLAMSTSWGLSSLIAMKFGSELESMPEVVKRQAANVPSMALYGVNEERQIALRSAGVPRNAALELGAIRDLLSSDTSLYRLRETLRQRSSSPWEEALGREKGADYFRVWQMLEGDSQ
ncbi:DEAD/DEAH box helicase [Ralstonia sp. 22111]|uniref:DEAD/DEAH box helicase n=1 Tax=Ralstonia sp. 22111 TaxID=3453878 RepID=UPI003F83025D